VSLQQSTAVALCMQPHFASLFFEGSPACSHTFASTALHHTVPPHAATPHRRQRHRNSNAEHRNGALLRAAQASSACASTKLALAMNWTTVGRRGAPWCSVAHRGAAYRILWPCCEVYHSWKQRGQSFAQSASWRIVVEDRHDEAS
jgi:hypothetical protein